VSADTEPVPDDPRFSPDRVRRRARRTAWIYAAAAALLIPWTIYLSVSLPKRDIDTHYRGAWVGFDLLLVTAIVLTAYFAFRVDTRVQLPATATATLLIVDAWFDVMTAGHRRATADAIVMAACIELPAALFSLWLVRRVNHNADRMARAALAAQAVDAAPH
jgi:hypothetical protein